MHLSDLKMGSSCSKAAKGSFNPTVGPTDTALLEDNYAAYYGSDTFNQLSAAAASVPVTHHTRNRSLDSSTSNSAKAGKRNNSFDDGFQRPVYTPTNQSFAQAFNNARMAAGTVGNNWNADSTTRSASVPAEREVTRPQPQGHKYRLSELIDPQDLLPSSGKSHIAEAYDPRAVPRSERTKNMQPSATSWRTPVYHSSNPPSNTSSANSSPSRRPLIPADVNKKLPSLVESPSGNIFGASEFAAHPNRPLAMRERQEAIRRATERAVLEKAADERRAELAQWRAQQETWEKKERKGSKDSGVSFGNIGKSINTFASGVRKGSNGSVQNETQSGSQSRKPSNGSVESGYATAPPNESQSRKGSAASAVSAFSVESGYGSASPTFNDSAWPAPAAPGGPGYTGATAYSRGNAFGAPDGNAQSAVPGLVALRIEEGRRAYEEQTARKNSAQEEGGKKKGLLKRFK